MKKIAPFLTIIAVILIFMSFTDKKDFTPFGYKWNEKSKSYEDIDECLSKPCLPGHTCINQPGYYRCVCPKDCKDRCNSACPNGGKKSTGDRSENGVSQYLIIDEKTDKILEIVQKFPQKRVGTRIEFQNNVAYTCDGTNPRLCWECNSYRL